MANLPPLPPGFKLDAPGNDIPPLPPGFQLDRPAPADGLPERIGAAALKPEMVRGHYGQVKPDPNYQPSMVPFLDPINALGTKLAESVPIAGPFLRDFGNQVDARFASAIEGREVTPEERQRINEADQAQYPLMNAAGTVAGTVGPFMAAGATEAGASALGMSGSLGQRIAMGGASGFGIAGADALARGVAPFEALKTAAVGAAGGAAFPVAERLVGATARALKGESVPREASIVSRGLERDGIDPASAAARLDALGPEAVIADLGPNVGRQAAAVASMPGQGQSAVRKALEERAAQANSRIQNASLDIFGPAPIPSYVARDIKQGQRALGPEYEQALAGASRVDPSRLALDLDSAAVNLRGEAQNVVEQVRRMLNVAGTDQLDPNPATLLQTRQAIDGMLDGAIDGNVKRVLGNARRQIDELLTDAVPGIKQVDARYAELARQNEALETGQRALESGREALRPQELADEMAAGALPQGMMVGPSGAAFRLSQGARAEIDRLIGTSANNLTALKGALKGDGSWNRDRLVTLFGREKADALLDVLERETTFARTNQVVMGNSATAERAAAQKDLEPRQFGERPMGIIDVLMRMPQSVANAALRAQGEHVNTAVGRALISRGNPDLWSQMERAQRLRQSRSVFAPASVPLLLNPAGAGP